MDSAKENLGFCPVHRGLTKVGDEWSMLIMRDAGFGSTRFDQFRMSLGIAPNILAQRLRKLTEAGLLAKSRYSERPPRDEYVITAAGRDFLPVLQAIAAWGRRHNGAGELSYTVDAETGSVLEPIVVDRTTGIPIGERPMRMVVPGRGR